MLAVDHFMQRAEDFRAPRQYVRDLQDEHNVNLHSDGTGDEFLDADPGMPEHMRVVSAEEFFHAYVID
jgi:hypothetical protein